MPAVLTRRLKRHVLRFARATLSIAPGLSVLAIAAAAYAIGAQSGRW